MPELPILYLDVDGVLQYAKDNQWKPRPEAAEFLQWAVTRFRCRWLTNWINPNDEIPRQLGVHVPTGIREVVWRIAGPRYPFKAAAISDAEDWLWLEDQPSDFDLADLRRRKQLDRLIRTDHVRPWILMSLVRQELITRLQERNSADDRDPPAGAG